MECSTYVIPSNDDAIRAIKLITAAMADACVEAKQGQVDVEVDEENDKEFFDNLFEEGKEANEETAENEAE